MPRSPSRYHPFKVGACFELIFDLNYPHKIKLIDEFEIPRVLASVQKSFECAVDVSCPYEIEVVHCIVCVYICVFG